MDIFRTFVQTIKTYKMNWNYISGFFDADGSITFTSSRKGKPKTSQISFHNTELTILEEIKDFILQEIGIKGFISKKKSYKENHSTSYDLKYNYLKKCLELSKHMKPIHPKKVKRLQSLPELQKLTPRNGKYTEELLTKRESLLESILT